MNDIRDFFTPNEWNMINVRLKEGRENTWYELAVRFNIRPEGTPTQRLKSANDLWRKYKKKVSKLSSPSKVLIFDIETSRVRGDMWWSGKQFVNGNSLISEGKIITIAYKWLGEDKIHAVKWDKNNCDKQLMRDFIKVYNQADMVIGYNNDRFDNKYLNARAMKFNLDIDVSIKSFDIMKQSKRLFRLPSYSMNYLAKYTGVATKLQHSGLEMWNNIQYGTKKEAKKSMKLMLKYNIQDIIVTEQVYLRVRKYMKNPIHIGVLQGKEKTTCTCCGSDTLKLYKTTTTSAGTIQHNMKCTTCSSKQKMSNRDFLKLKNND